MPSTSPRPTLGLALGGGGARGLAHVGVLKALDEAGLQPKVIAGTSMGSLIGGAYAAGFSARAIEREVLHLASRSRLINLADRIPSLRALFTGRRFEQYLNRTLGAELTFADLRRPLAIATTDLNSGQEVIFTEGAVVPAIRASISIPGVFAAVERDGRRLVDGGLLNNVPADLARDLGADLVLAVDVLPHYPAPGEEQTEERFATAPEVATPMELPLAPPGLQDVWDAAFVVLARLMRCNLERSRPDLIVRPTLAPSITLLTGYTRAEEPIEAGYQAMRAALPRLREMLETTVPTEQD